VFAVHAPGKPVAHLCYLGLFALQHRGQESAGIAVSNGRQILVYKDMGLVSQVFDESTLSSLVGRIAIGHCRYSTTGASTWKNAQPTFRPTHDGALALGHNGNLINTHELKQLVDALPKEQAELDLHLREGDASTNDTSLVTALLAHHPDTTLEQRAIEVLPLLKGAFSFVWMNEDTLYAARDPQGIRPLVLGRLARGWVVASEDAALATIAGRHVHAARVAMGRRLAEEHPVDADLVIPVPESGTPAAIGYAEESGIPYGMGLVKNSYVGRTFIQPSQTIRQLGIRLKLNPLRDVIAGRRLVVVDDSIVRGNTQRAQVRLLREAGAIAIHVRISSPPVKWPCFYGIDFATRAELIANGLDTEGIRRSIGADSLGYVSLDGLISATEQPRTRLCRACFDGVYPIELPVADRRGKHVLEEKQPDGGPVRTDVDGLMTATMGLGAADALSRP
jgi:amidophosphoribosyltransferase